MHPRFSLLILAIFVVSCQAGPSSEDATATFADCLERNGIVAEDVQVTVGDDGAIEGIEARILEEGAAAYEPAIRLACTAEVEADR